MSSKKCLFCLKQLVTKFQIKYCSNKCQKEYLYKIFIDKWRKGLVNGTIGVNIRFTSKHIRRYLIETTGEKCSQCGWNARHSITGRVPLEIDHADGNSENGIESNLRLLCPNCHSLTLFYKNLNRGMGRKWRMKKYIKEAAR